MDNLTKEQRALCMSHIKSKNTKPELIVRKILSKLGIRYLLHSSKLPGKPDIMISKKKTIIFINGCFWHQHKNCKKQALPATNKDYWEKKLKRNVEKQRRDIRALRALGWEVHKIWECQTADEIKISNNLLRML
jgi:DNA mismatch endonuclease (patch repair protein)